MIFYTIFQALRINLIHLSIIHNKETITDIKNLSKI